MVKLTKLFQFQKWHCWPLVSYFVSPPPHCSCRYHVHPPVPPPPTPESPLHEFCWMCCNILCIMRVGDPTWHIALFPMCSLTVCNSVSTKTVSWNWGVRGVATRGVRNAKLLSFRGKTLLSNQRASSLTQWIHSCLCTTCGMRADDTTITLTHPLAIIDYPPSTRMGVSVLAHSIREWSSSTTQLFFDYDY